MPKQKKSTKETERFVDLARKLVAVPKKEIEKRLELERQQKAEGKNEKRKA
jgi:hypothetical protein